jgi:hypothetical protein
LLRSQQGGFKYGEKEEDGRNAEAASHNGRNSTGKSWGPGARSWEPCSVTAISVEKRAGCR